MSKSYVSQGVLLNKSPQNKSCGRIKKSGFINLLNRAFGWTRVV